MQLDKYSYTTEVSGPKVLFLGAIHGDETAGSKAMMRLKQMLDNKEISLQNGSLQMMPICNPLAHSQNKRFVNKNLNRIIGLYTNPQEAEELFANQVAEAILAADYVVDFHSTHCKGDKPFAFLDYPLEQNQTLVSALSVGYVLKNWPAIYANQNELSDFSTEKFAYLHGKSAITVECGYHHDAKSAELALSDMLNLLSVLEMTTMPSRRQQAQVQINMDKFVLKTASGHLAKNYNHLDRVGKNDVIAVYDNGLQIRAEQDGYILIPNHQAEIGTEWFYLGH